MTSGSVPRRLAAAVAIALFTVGAIGDLAASVVLKDGDKINGLIRTTSPGFQFRNTTRSGAPAQRARGEEHTFTAQRGDSLEISIEPEDGSALRPALLLLDPTGRQVAYSENPGVFRYQVVRPGTYRLIILGRNNTAGRYTPG